MWKFKLQIKGSFYIHPRSIYLFLYSSIPHYALESYLKLIPGFWACFKLLHLPSVYLLTDWLNDSLICIMLLYPIWSLTPCSWLVLKSTWRGSWWRGRCTRITQGRGWGAAGGWGGRRGRGRVTKRRGGLHVLTPEDGEVGVEKLTGGPAGHRHEVLLRQRAQVPTCSQGVNCKQKVPGLRNFP